MALGNIVFGGVIGAGVDMSTGAAYDYPAVIVVEIGQTLSVPPVTASTGVRPASEAPVGQELSTFRKR